MKISWQWWNLLDLWIYHDLSACCFECFESLDWPTLPGSHALCLSLCGQDRSGLDGAVFLCRPEGSSWTSWIILQSLYNGIQLLILLILLQRLYPMSFSRCLQQFGISMSNRVDIWNSKSVRLQVWRSYLTDPCSDAICKPRRTTYQWDPIGCRDYHCNIFNRTWSACRRHNAFSRLVILLSGDCRANAGVVGHDIAWGTKNLQFNSITHSFRRFLMADQIMAFESSKDFKVISTTWKKWKT